MRDVTDREVRILRPSELRAAQELFRRALHTAPNTDEQWERSEPGYRDSVVVGAFDGGSMVGTARALDSLMTVPGDSRVPFAAVTGVAVRPDRTRRGVLRDLMRYQLDEVAGRGVPLAALHASEAVIYERFGYGVASRERSVRVDRRRARVIDGAPTGGEIELYDLDAAVRLLPEIYDRRTLDRVGMMSRSHPFWAMWEGHYRRANGEPVLAVHRGPSGIDGYAAYRVPSDIFGNDPVVLRVEDMFAGSPEAFADLWRYLLSVDLVDRISVTGRPVDEPLELLFTDPRACSVHDVSDEVWLRLVDVHSALSARTFSGDESLVLEVKDAFLPANAGHYEVSPDGVRRTEEAAGLRCSADTLAALYLGGWSATQLAATGRLEVVDQAAVAVADRLLGTERPPWCGTFF